MKAFLQNLDLRPSCHHCRAKGGMSNSDLTIADFWGIQNVAAQMDDDKGTNLILVNTARGRKILIPQNLNVLKFIQRKPYDTIPYGMTV